MSWSFVSLSVSPVSSLWSISRKTVHCDDVAQHFNHAKLYFAASTATCDRWLFCRETGPNRLLSTYSPSNCDMSSYRPASGHQGDVNLQEDRDRQNGVE